jgi:HEAT repeat protein
MSEPRGFETSLEELVAEYGEAYRTARERLLAKSEGLLVLLHAGEQSGSWRVRLAARALLLWHEDEAACRRAGELMRGNFRLGSIVPITGSYPAFTRAQQIAELGARIVPRLLELLVWERPPDDTAEAALLVALVQFRDALAVAPLVALLDKREPPARRRSCAEALGRLGDRSAAPALIDALADTESQLAVRRACALALGMLRAPEATLPLQVIFSNPENPTPLRSDAVAALALVGGQAAAQPILSLLPVEHDSALIERMAMALADTRDRAALPALRGLAREHADRRVRQAATGAAEVLARRLGG